jgi:hypothetical protein
LLIELLNLFLFDPEQPPADDCKWMELLQLPQDQLRYLIIAKSYPDIVNDGHEILNGYLSNGFVNLILLFEDLFVPLVILLFFLLEFGLLFG